MSDLKQGRGPLAAGLERLLASEVALAARTRLLRWSLHRCEQTADIARHLREEAKRSDQACESLAGALAQLGLPPRRSLDDLLRLSSIDTAPPDPGASLCDALENVARQHEKLAEDSAVLVLVLRPADGPLGARRIVLRLRSSHEKAAADWRARAAEWAEGGQDD